MGTNNCEIINDIKATPDGGFAYVGYRGYDALIVKTDALGNVLWENQIGGGAQDELYSVSLTSDGGYVASGFAFSNDGDLAGVPGNGTAWFIRTDANGEIMWQRRLNGTGIPDIGYDIKEIGQGQYIACGLIDYSNTGSGVSDMFIAKLVPENMGTDSFENLAAMVYPNPAVSTLHIGLPDSSNPEIITVYDSAGRNIGTYQGSSINISGLANGVYFVNANMEGKNFKAKFVKE